VADWAECVPLLVQPFVAGVGEGVFGVAAPEGVRAWSAHRRLRMMNPKGSGSSACISQAVPEDVRTKVEALVRATGWCGLFMVELLRDADGKAWFVELNGRPWGSMSLCRRQGLEYPAWHVQLALDPQSPAGRGASFTPGVVCRNAGREFLHLLFVLRGPKSKALNGWPSIGKTLVDVLRVRRSDTWYNWRRDDAKVFFILNELDDIDDDVPRPGIGHDPLHLAHFMYPKAPQVLVHRTSGLPPQLEFA